MISDFNGKVAVVTGGASGIGYALAERLAAEGMRVVLADVEPAPLQAAADALGAIAMRTDVSDLGSVQALAGQVRDRLGTVHLICNNAGVSAMAGIRSLSLADFRWLMDVNFFGVVHGVKAFAAVGFSEALDLELKAEGSKVGVSVLCPGPVRTNIRTSARNRGPGYGPIGRREGEPDIHERAFRGTVQPDLWIDPEEAADAVVEAVREGRFWVLTQPELAGPYERRTRDIGEELIRLRRKS